MTDKTKTRADLVGEIESRLLGGDDPQAIADELGLSTADDSRDDDYSWSGLAVVLPGWVADDGNAAVEFDDAASRRAAAQEYVDDGDWGEATSTEWYDVWTWQRGLVLIVADDQTGKRSVVTVDLDKECIRNIALDPPEPDCDAGHHEWCSPHSVVGGIAENPGVWGKGGGVTIKQVCRHCGYYRHRDTWAQRYDTGEQGLDSVEYCDPDDASLAWVEAQAEEEN